MIIPVFIHMFPVQTANVSSFEQKPFPNPPALPLPTKDGRCSIFEKKLCPVPVAVQTVSVAQKLNISRRKSKLSGMMGTTGHWDMAKTPARDASHVGSLFNIV